MKIQLTVIEDLGIKLYASLPAVLSEIVANAWDAEAHHVTIAIPEGVPTEKSMISVEDDGIGMTYQEIQDHYLRIGRKRREEESRETTANLGRPIMGRKGIGKLSVFGVAKIVDVTTVKDDLLTIFRMDVESILHDARSSGTYRPEVLAHGASAGEKQGTSVRLSGLKRTTPIDIEAVRKQLARHFSVLSDDFRVKVNEAVLTKAHKFSKSEMEYVWEIKDEPVHPIILGWKVSGWIGTTKEPLNEHDRGIIVMARGKLLQTPTAFESKVGEQFAYSYIVGELHAEFLDEAEDLIATHRQSVVWESPQGAALKEWGERRLKAIAGEWAKARRTNREKVIREDPEFKTWLQGLPSAEQKVADKVIRAITVTEAMTDDRRRELAGYMKQSFDQKVFQEMVSELGESPNDAKLIEIFEQWDIIEAREILRLVKGRISTIEQFEKHVNEDAREKPTFHNFFRNWPWILDPTWTRWQDEIRYSTLLREKFPDQILSGPDRRIDFVCIGVGDTVHVVELKRPGHAITSKDIDQLIAYREFVRNQMGTSPERGYKDAAAYIVAGRVSSDPITQAKIKLIESGRMYVKRYNDLLVVARQLHSEFEDKLREFGAKPAKNEATSPAAK